MAVTLGLVLTGIAVGALCAAAAVAAILVVRDGPSGAFSRGTGALLARAAALGAGLGAVAAPALAWGLLRRVPLGRAVTWTALGTVAGAVAGEWLRPLNPYARAVPGVVLGTLVGFAASGVALRRRGSEERAASPRSAERAL